MVLKEIVAVGHIHFISQVQHNLKKHCTSFISHCIASFSRGYLPVDDIVSFASSFSKMTQIQSSNFLLTHLS